jgi:ABC-2 type transport system permease protein
MNNAGILVIKRAVIGLIRNPGATLFGFGMSLFFLVVYSAGIGGIEFLPQFKNGGYLAFLLPLSIVYLATGSASGAGQALNRDMQSGYFYRLYLSPVSRAAFVIAPMLADAFALVVETVILLIIGAIFGVPFTYGLWSILGIIFLAVLFGITLSGFSAGVVIATGNPQTSQMLVMAIFPLLFLSTTFLPYDMISASWLKVVSWVNPVTYLMEGMRFLLAGSTPGWFLAVAFAFSAVSAMGAIIFAVTRANKALV